MSAAALYTCIAAAQAGADTRAGTAITNVAGLSVATGEGAVAWIASNSVVLTVAERLDVALSRSDADGPIDATGGAVVRVTLVNRGNGREAFDLAATLPDASARVRLIAVDRNGDGRFDAAIDTPLAQGRTDPLDPGEALPLLVVLDPAVSAITANALTVTARAVTGSGPVGTTFAGQGDGGGDAVTGPTEAQAEVAIPLAAAAAGDAPVLFKSQSVRAPNGGSVPVSGAIVTYRLEARFAAPVQSARITDPIPAGTRYVAGSLTLDGAPLSDAADGDAGTGGASGIAVALSAIPASASQPVSRVIQFQVVIP